jgi:hypothetical protein
MYDPECKAALLSLYVPGTRNRQDQVEDAETHTFDWIYDNHNLEFETWLGDARPLYWIQGKPASGKSTLMKLLCKDPRTDAAASRPDSQTVRAAFFFHDRGSQTQKSFDGLLHSILHQILETVPELVPSILPVYRNKHSLEPWGTGGLLAALEKILAQSRLKLAVYLFLDALDAYSGDHRGMADFLHNINQERVASKTLVQVCFSSRPLQIFLDKFHHVPGFKLQQYTEGDISIVIRAMMEDNERFARYLQSSNEYDRNAIETIAEDILQRADGVFLWVIESVNAWERFGCTYEFCFLFSSINVHTGLCHIQCGIYLEDQKFVILFNNIFSHDAEVMSESRVEAMCGDGRTGAAGRVVCVGSG